MKHSIFKILFVGFIFSLSGCVTYPSAYVRPGAYYGTGPYGNYGYGYQPYAYGYQPYGYIGIRPHFYGGFRYGHGGGWHGRH